MRPAGLRDDEHKEGGAESETADEELETLPSVTIDFFDVELGVEVGASTLVCNLEGHVQVFDAPVLDTFREVIKLLELTNEKSIGPSLLSERLVVLISTTDHGTNSRLFARIEVDVANGFVCAAFHDEHGV
jgi:hypothetical protein